MRIFFFSIFFLVGCSATLPLDTWEDHATITFEDHEKMSYFNGIDGYGLRNVPSTIVVKPGEHTIRYMCLIHVDGPPASELTLYARSGKTYALRCLDAEHAEVVEH